MTARDLTGLERISAVCQRLLDERAWKDGEIVIPEFLLAARCDYCGEPAQKLHRVFRDGRGLDCCVKCPPWNDDPEYNPHSYRAGNGPGRRR